ncbi:SusC/RagA family TonB-linked outer membrane protein [Dysgonomonas sp.]
MMKHLKTFPFFLLLFFSFPFLALGQGIQNRSVITGTVKDQLQAPLVGVVVKVKNTTQGVATDIDGKFELSVGEKDPTLIFSLMGYLSKEIKITDSNNVSVILEEDNKLLDEVVVIGYQAMRRKDLTGAVASVRATELNVTAPNVGQSLVGKIAGVQISQVSGAPYDGVKIRVRGTASVNASSDPLYVIDGYPSAGGDPFINPEDIESIEVLKDAASAAIYGSRAAGGVVLITTKRGKEGKPKVDFGYQIGFSQLAKKVDMLNSQQFAELLVDGRNNTYKDLMIKAGKTWNDTMFSDDNATRTQKLGSSNSGVKIPDFLYDFANQKVLTPEYDTDWQDELYRNAPFSRYNLSVAGGNKAVRYMVNLGYQDEQGIIVTTKQRRLNLRSNIDIDVTDRLSIGTNIAMTNNWNAEVEEGRFDKGPILGALVYAPIFKPYNEDGSFSKYEMASLASEYGFQQIENPVALASETKISRTGQRHTYNVFSTYKITSYLQAKANLAMYNYTEKYEHYRPTSLSTGTNAPYSDAAKAAAYARAATKKVNDYLGEFTVNFDKEFGKQRINGVAGYAMQRNTQDVIDVTATGFQDDYIPEITAGGADPSYFTLNSATGKSNWSMLSYFARLNYSFKSRYFLTGSFRGDGSSLFSPDNRWGYFPSVSAGWNTSEESFYQNLFGNASTLRLRTSWGLSGNNNLSGNYNFLQTMSEPSGIVFGTGTVNSAMYPEGFKDKNIGWEKTSQYNLGADLGLFKGRLSLSGNFYVSYTYDLLFNQSVSAVSGSTSVLTNLPDSKIRNRGFDLQVDGRIISTKDFDLAASANILINRNKVLDMGGASTILTNGAERSYKTHITMEGQPIGMFYGFKVAGMVTEADMGKIAIDDQYYNASSQSFPDGYKIQGPARSTASTTALAPGDIYFEDVNGDGVVNDADKTIIGSPHPDFTYGFTINARYKTWDLSAAFNGSQGNKILDGQDYYIFNMEGSGNQYAVVSERYRNAENPGNGSIYRASRGGTQSNNTRLSTFYLQDGSYLRCTNLTIGYNVPTIKKITNNSLSSLRFFASVNNLFTITDYLGYNPDVDYNNGSNLTPGVDYGKYPLARSFNFGLQASF